MHLSADSLFGTLASLNMAPSNIPPVLREVRQQKALPSKGEGESRRDRLPGREQRRKDNLPFIWSWQPRNILFNAQNYFSLSRLAGRPGCRRWPGRCPERG